MTDGGSGASVHRLDAGTPRGVVFEVFPGGRVTVDGRVVDREDLRRVLAVADREAAA